MKKSLARSRAPAHMDVSLAIVNIVLLLIFFFLATGRLLNPAGAEIELSETTELPLDQLPEPILVINKDGSWALNGAKIVPENLDLALSDLPQPVVLYLLINRTAPANTLLAVINRPELQETEVRLVTLHKRDTP